MRLLSPLARWRRARLIGSLAAIAVLCAAGVGLYLDERSAEETKYFAGARRAANRVDLDVTVQQVDATNGDLIMRVLVTPQGALARADGTPASNLAVDVGSSIAAELHFPAGQPIAEQSVRVSIENSGIVTDYPFDHYTTPLIFGATAGGRDVPSYVSLREIDPFFITKVRSTVPFSGVVVDEIRISRSRGTLILAWFMMIAMWALALSVLGGALILAARRQGMVWPALGWMAATLFALIGMRNAAPGSPPIGSLIDYASFFWAEAIVAGSLTYVAVTGIRAERDAARSETTR
jgi:Domain of unknown function (DUF4436)